MGVVYTRHGSNLDEVGVGHGLRYRTWRTEEGYGNHEHGKGRKSEGWGTDPEGFMEVLCPLGSSRSPDV